MLSGINHGPNLGTDILYSGTVSAAMEGIIEGIPSIAFSLASYTSRDFQAGVNFAQNLVANLIEKPMAEPMLLNVNIPAVQQAEIAGVAIARQGIRRYFDIFQKRVDPRGKSYYWLAGELLEEVEETTDPHLPHDIPTDVQAIRQNYITLTPLQYNLTYAAALHHLPEWKFESFGN